MPRKARIVIKKFPHHITQRGNNRQEVFFNDQNRQEYLSILKIQSRQYGLEILGWCLMPNHIHLIARPCNSDSLAKAIGRTNFIYTQHINEIHNRSGHLWQNRFFSCPLSRDHFWQALRYIEQNPIRASLAKYAWDYQWSSAKAHIENKDNTGILDIQYWKQISSTLNWSKILQTPQPKKHIKEIQSNTLTGHLLASDEFTIKLEKILKKSLRTRPVGRPKK